MIVSNICKNLYRTRLLCYGGSLASLSNALKGRFADYGEWNNSRKTDNKVSPSYKSYCSGTQASPRIGLPPLCDFPVQLWPKFFDTIRNFFIINMVIKSRLDREFNQKEFISATRQALYTVSRALANEDYERLEGLVTREAMETLKTKISTLSDEQKKLIAVQDDDVYLSYPHTIEILNEGERDRERKFVQILVVHHYMQGFGRMRQAEESLPMNRLSDYQDRIFVANHRYIREYTEGIDSPWILNVVNHLSPSLLVNLVNFTQEKFIQIHSSDGVLFA